MTASNAPTHQDDLYRQAAGSLEHALARLVRGYEADAEKRKDLMQEIHLALWRSFAGFDGRCSLRTWTYRVAHNVGASHIARQRRTAVTLLALEEIELLLPVALPQEQLEADSAMQRLLLLIEQLRPLDRELMLLYLEDVDAAGIAEVTGLSAVNVATKVHRIKAILARQFHGDAHDH